MLRPDKRYEGDVEFLRKNRDEKFRVSIRPVRVKFLYDDEVDLEVTHNGQAWKSINLNRSELGVLYRTIGEYLEQQE